MKSVLLYLLNFLLLSSLSAQDMQRVKNYIDTLAAPGMHGRGYVKQGDKIAANYLKDRFKKIGVLPFKDSSKFPQPYFQTFSFNINTFSGTVCLSIEKNKLETGEDYILNPASGSGDKTLKVKFLDTLIFTYPDCQKKFLQSNTSKIALAFYSRHSKQIQQLPKEYSQKIFSSGAIIEIQEKKLTAALSTYQLKTPYFEVLQEDFRPKTKKVSFDIDAELKKDYESQNVIGFIKGKSKPDSFIVISAHYDHLGRMGKDVYFPGANDNASGISMMLELAEYYSAPENQPEYSIAFMAFGAEEAGLIGSEFYVKNPLFPLEKIKFLINLDLLGTGEEGITIVNATKFPEQFDMLTKINEDKKLLPSINKRGPAANSDHYYFTERGVPAFFIYTLGGIKAYHDIYDRAETLPLTKFTEVFQLLKNFIAKF